MARDCALDVIFDDFWIKLIGEMLPGLFITVNETDLLVALLSDVSRAIAATVCAPLLMVVVFKVTE